MDESHLMNKKKENNQINKINLLISCYEVSTLETAVKQIIKKLEELKLNYAGPIPLPRKKKVVAVIRSPHKHSVWSREHLGRITYRRSIKIFSASLTNLNFARFVHSHLQIQNNVDIRLKQS